LLATVRKPEDASPEPTGMVSRRVANDDTLYGPFTRLQPILTGTLPESCRQPEARTVPSFARAREAQAAYPPVSIPRLAQSPSTLDLTASLMRMGRPHSRIVSPFHLAVASRPIFDPSPATGEAKSR
jgi:hypothetical protein